LLYESRDYPLPRKLPLRGAHDIRNKNQTKRRMLASTAETKTKS